MTVELLTEDELRRLHKVQLEMLIELDRVCCRLGVAYQLGAGSLLGAVRHAGFIPWDKDIDVVMLRADYRRFLRGAPQLLDSRLFLQTWRSDHTYSWFFAKLRRHDSVFLEANCLPSGQHQGVYIDIFPFDSVWPECWWWCALHAVVLLLDRWIWKLKFLAADANRSQAAGGHQAGHPSGRQLVGSILHWGLVRVPPSLLMAIHVGLLRSLALVPSSQVVCLASGSLRRERLRALTRRSEEFEQTVRMPFEGLRFPVSANYHQALTRLYGNYMHLPPTSNRKIAVEKFYLPEDGGLNSERLERKDVAPQSGIR
jgi:lipopolysaccharide cholinephosphotransferase